MNHTPEELKIIESYKNSVDQDIYHCINAAYSGEQVYPVTVGFLSDVAANEIEKLTGKTVNGNRIVLDLNGINHIKNRHGENGEHDDSMKNIEDIARMGYVLANYDHITFRNEYAQGYVDANGKPAPKVIISKRINGTYYIIEAVSDAKKHRNYIVSAYIRPRNHESDSLVLDNA